VEGRAPLWEFTGLDDERYDERMSGRSHVQCVQGPVHFLLAKPDVVEPGSQADDECVTRGNRLADLLLLEVPQH